MSCMKDTAILLDKVSLRLGQKDFLFDHAIEAGKITAVTGASGAGKSTLLNLIAGFDRPDEGRILIHGADVTDLHPGERPLSFIFQDNNLFAHLDLQTNIGLGINPALKLSAQDKTAISQALERVGLAGFEHRKSATLSGGERQRAAFARALVRDKPVLLLDEPFAALDVELRHRMSELLAELHRETGRTIVLVSHNPDDVTRLADYVITIENGRIAPA